MKKIAILAAVAAVVLFGCKSINVDNRGQAPLLNADGSVVLDSSGRPYFYSLGWETSYFQHWNWQRFDSFGASIRTNGTIDVTINGYASGADSNLVQLVSQSLAGVATITEKVCAAIVTYGGSVAAEGGSAAINALANKFISSGGDAAKATVSCAKDGSCTVTDGCVTCSEPGVCTDCNL